MKLSKHYKKRLKKKILNFTVSIALITSTLAISKLVGFSAPLNFLEEVGNDLKVAVTDEIEMLEEELGIQDETTSRLNGITISGKYIEFEKDRYNYNIQLDYNVPDLVTIEVDKKADSQEVKGEGDYIIGDSETICLKVISGDKSATSTYTLNITRPHSNYLKTLEVIGYNISPEFNPDITTYSLEKLPEVNSIDIYATAFDKEAIITIQGNSVLSDEGSITITVTEPHIDTSAVYVINYGISTGLNNFSYSGNYEEFVAPYTGLYQMQCWGARGGGSRMNGSFYATYGKGGYASGKIKLKKGEKLFLYVGGHGTDSVVGKDSAGGWNGGGLGTWDRSDNETSGGGGGATDIRLLDGEWNDTKSLASRIMVAGGGGGTSWNYAPGHGGGVTGTTNYSVSPAGTQTSGYLFGIGRDGWGKADNDGVAGRWRRLLWWSNK